MSAMKLQKLCYYAYGYHLAWEERRLFPERFEAWANGPCARSYTSCTAVGFSSPPVTCQVTLVPWMMASGNPSILSSTPTAP